MRFLSSILSLVITGVLFVVFINPFYNEVISLRSDIDVYNKALSNSNDLEKTRDALVDQYKQISKEDKERLNHMLPSSINNIELILEIEKIANVYGMPIGDIRFDSKSLEGGSSSNAGVNPIAGGVSENSLPYGVFPMDFSVQGGYKTFVSFLKELEKNLRLVDVKAISFSSSSSKNDGEIGSDIYNYSLKVQTYWLK